MKTYCFTVDDNIRFLKEIAERRPVSLFDHPYLKMYRRLHEAHGVKVQLNLFERLENFDLSQMPDTYRKEWEAQAHWLKLSFHSREETFHPYETAAYDQVFTDCQRVHEEILRFATASNLAKTTTIHWCQTTEEGVRALYDLGVEGLLGLFGNGENPKTSYSLAEDYAKELRQGKTLCIGDVSFAAITFVINNYNQGEILAKLDGLQERDALKVMIHEQYFYPDYDSYQPDFEEKLSACFARLTDMGYQSRFFEEVI